MNKPFIISEIIKRIESAENGTIFVPTDFVDIADNKKIATVLARIEQNGKLKRIMRGVYEKSEYNEYLGEYIVPSPNKVAEAIARNFGWTIVPCGDTALNMLGLSTQVPSVWLYVSDGVYKEYSYDSVIIKFKRITNKEISKLSYKSALVVQALKALKRENISQKILLQIADTLTAEEKRGLLEETRYVTSWIYNCIKQICTLGEVK